MEKKILSLALIAMSVVSISVTGQTKTATSCDAKVKTACAVESCGNPGKQCRKAPCPFDGLTLTDAQKAQLQQLNASSRKASEAEAKNRRADKLRSDSSRIAACRADKREYLKQVKSIIGPEQYIIFLENAYVNGGGQLHRGKAAIGKGRMAKAHGLRGGDHKFGKQGDRPFKARTNALNESQSGQQTAD